MSDCKTYIITIPNETAKKFDQILKDEEMNEHDWLENAVEDYDS